MPNERSSFLEELKQRHVFRVAAMYAVTSWLLLQLGSVTLEPLGFPGWSQRALILLIAVGFPIALGLAWIFDVTPEGVVRTDTAPTSGLSRGRKLDIVIIVALLAALAVTFVWRREPTSAPVAAQDASVAVLPFVAMSEDASLRHFGEGLSEQITNELAVRSELRVASRTSAFEQAGKDAVAIAHALGVSYVLEGSVRPSGDKVRLTAQLVRGQDGSHVWADTYDVAASDASAWDQTASLVAASANSYMQLERELQRARTFTTNAEAFEHFAAARRLGWQQATGGTAMERPSVQMLGELDRAIALDPNFFPAHLERANVFFRKLDRGGACGERCITEARSSIDRALALQPDDPDALRQLGYIQLFDELDPAAAEATFERVRQIDPANRSLNASFAYLAMFRGNAQDAREYWVRQLEVSPYTAFDHYGYAILLLGIGDLDGALREVEAGLRLAPRGQAAGVVAPLHINLLIQLGKIDEAKAEFDPLWAQQRYTHPELYVRELASLGYEREAHELMAKLTRAPDVDPFVMFLNYAGLGRTDDALAQLRRAIDGRSFAGVLYVRFPQGPGVREQPGFVELVKYLDSIQRSH